MSEVPTIISYYSDDAPESERWVSFFRTNKTLPMVFRGETKDAVAFAARDWWLKEIAKDAARKERLAKMREQRQNA